MSWRVEDGTPYRNVCDLEFRDRDGADEVAFAAAPHGSPETLWFCFRLARQPGAEVRPLRLVLQHAETMLGCNRPEGMRPVVRTPNVDWVRQPAPEVRELPDGRSEWCWSVTTSEPWLDVALCYPYGRDEIAALRSRCGIWRQDTIGVSHASRPIERLANDYGEEGGDRPGIYCVARQHSGEVSGSWALDGFLDRMAELGDAAPLIWAAPLSNIDGVEQGDYGKDNYPYDLNRAWEPLMRHETLVISRDILRWRQRCRPIAVLDWHSPAGTASDGIFVFGPDPDRVPELAAAAEPWLEVLADSLGPVAAEQFSRVVTYRSRWETMTLGRWVRERLELQSLTFEVSYAMSQDGVLTREDYRQAGRRLADAMDRLVTAGK